MSDYTRLSIEKLKPEFTGWDHYIELMEQIPTCRYSSDTLRDQGFFSIIFELGCRIREVLGLYEKGKLLSEPLKRSNFLFTKPKRLIITDIPILKRYEKISSKIRRELEIPSDTPPSHRKLWQQSTEDGLFEKKVWDTKRLNPTRRIEIPLDEPLLQKYGLPFLKEKDGVLFDRSYDYFYKLCVNLNPLKNKYPKVPEHIFPHWWRAQRACQLATEYHFSLHELVDFFEWKDMITAQRYAHLAGTLGDKMSNTRTVWRKHEKKETSKLEEKEEKSLDDEFEEIIKHE